MYPSSKEVLEQVKQVALRSMVFSWWFSFIWLKNRGTREQEEFRKSVWSLLMITSACDVRADLHTYRNLTTDFFPVYFFPDHQSKKQCKDYPKRAEHLFFFNLNFYWIQGKHFIWIGWIVDSVTIQWVI